MHSSSATLVVSVLVTALASSAQALPTHQWSKRGGDTQEQVTYSVAFDPSGNIVIAGELFGTVDFGGGPLTSAGGKDIFVAKFDPAGNHIWSKRFGSTGGESASDVATDAAGNVIICGASDGTLNFGGGNMGAAGALDMFIAKLTPAGGYLWAKRFGFNAIAPALYFNVASRVAIDSANNVVVVGSLEGQINFGGGALTSQGSDDIVVLKYSAAGAHVWSKRFGTTALERGSALAIDSADNVVVGSYILGATDFGGGAVPVTSAIAEFSPSGAHVWSTSFTGGDSFIRNVAVDHAGAVIATGDFNGSTNFGGGALVAPDYDVFVTKYDAAGVYQWSKACGGAGNDDGSAVAIDATNNLILVGGFHSSIDFGGGPIATAGDLDMYFAKLAPDGTHVWSTSFADANFQNGLAVATDNAGGIAITGEVSGTVDAGGGPLTGNAYDFLVAKYQDSQPVPVLISGFQAKTRGDAIDVQWHLWSDEGLDKYALYRTSGLNSTATVVAAGSDMRVQSYHDTQVVPGQTYQYQLVVRTADGNETQSALATASTPPVEARLEQNHPNPFNPSTTIEYSLNAKTDVVIGIYDAQGALVTSLAQGVRDAGRHAAKWDGRDARSRVVSSGVYFYRLEGVPGVAPRKMIMLK